MTTSQMDTHEKPEAPYLSGQTFKGKLIPGQRDGFLELDTPDARYELLGPLDERAQVGTKVEVVAVPVPRTRNTKDLMPALLVRHIRPA